MSAVASTLSNQHNCTCARKTLQTQRGRMHGAGCVRRWFGTAEPLRKRCNENWNTHSIQWINSQQYCNITVMEVCYNNNSSILLGNWTSRPIAKSAHCKLGPLPSRPIQPWPITNSAHDYKIALVLIQRLIITDSYYYYE